MDTKILRRVAESLVSDIKHLRLDGPEPDSASQAEVTRLQSAKLMGEAADEIERLEGRIRVLQREVQEAASGAALDAATEASWRERQGDDYGSY